RDGLQSLPDKEVMLSLLPPGADELESVLTKLKNFHALWQRMEEDAALLDSPIEMWALIQRLETSYGLSDREFPPLATFIRRQNQLRIQQEFLPRLRDLTKRLHRFEARTQELHLGNSTKLKRQACRHDKKV
ncbi:unnamed protein product, partial [Amoebophrya sp. A25]